MGHAFPRESAVRRPIERISYSAVAECYSSRTESSVGRMQTNMEANAAHSERQDEPCFYLYSPSIASSPLHSGNVFYLATDEQSARTLCRLFTKEYSSEGEGPHFLAQSAHDIEFDEQIVLDEALDWLGMYGDPDPGIYDPPPTPEMIRLAQYAQRANIWESMLRARKHDRKIEAVKNDAEPFQMPEEDKLNSALNLLFMLAQTYYKILESALGMATWCSALDLELNESYLWTTSNLQNLLKNHDGLRDFTDTFKPFFPDLYPSTIRDVEWSDMVAPEVEQFLSSVQRYVREKGMYPPEEKSPAWTFVEMFRPSVNLAIERAAAYDQRMRTYA